MKKLQRQCMVCVFTLALTTTTFAGDIQTGKPLLPPGPPSATVQGDIATPGKDLAQPGDIQTPRPATSETVAEIALCLLQAMISVF